MSEAVAPQTHHHATAKTKPRTATGAAHGANGAREVHVRIGSRRGFRVVASLPNPGPAFVRSDSFRS